MKILMVCLGNICRSPLAEGILRVKLPGDEFTIDSAGTINYHEGKAPDERSVAVARRNGIDISKQKSRPITSKDLDNFDYIFCMDTSNYHDVLKMADTESQRSKIYRLLEFADHSTLNVPDPYYGGLDGFTQVYDLLDEACTTVAEKLSNS